MKPSDYVLVRDLRDRAASLATTAATHLREIAIFAAPLDSTSFAQMQRGEQTIRAANKRFEDTGAVIADLANVLAELSQLLAGPSATPDRKGVNL